MTGRALIDSNGFVYAFDAAARDKQARAARLLEQIEPIGRGMLPLRCWASSSGS